MRYLLLGNVAALVRARRLLVVTVLLALGVAVLPACRSGPAVPVLERCVEHERLGMHIHPHLTVMVDGVATLPPGGIGISPNCMRPLHTHDASGYLHIEYPERRDFLLGDFFQVWGEPFKDKRAVSVTVNGEPFRGDYRSIVLRDGQRIVVWLRSP